MSLTVLKQQSNSLQEGPRCNPFTANGTGWSKGGCTHDTEENRRALLPVPSPGWLSGTRTACPSPWGTPSPRTAACSHHPPWPGTQPCPLQPAMRLRLLRARPKTRAAASRIGVSRLPPRGWPWGTCRFLVYGSYVWPAAPWNNRPFHSRWWLGLSLGRFAFLKLSGQKG